VYSLRTHVTSLHHNVSAALSETFGASWRLTGEPVWLLGRRYQDVGGGADGLADGVGVVEEEGSPEDFAAAWSRISRMTYRKGFAPMYRPVRSSSAVGGGASTQEPRRRYVKLTSDAGWGCMIRVGQMLLAAVLKRHSAMDTHSSKGEDSMEQFLDDPCPRRSPFSIFSFIRVARGGEGWAHRYDGDSGFATCPNGAEVSSPREDYTTRQASPPPGNRVRQLAQKLPGDWFGPTTISETIAALVEGTHGLRETLSVYVNADGVIYEDEVWALACDGGASGEEVVAVSDGDDDHTASRGVSSSPSAEDGASCHNISSRRSPRGDNSCGGDADDDEFTVVSTASVGSTTAWVVRPSAVTDEHDSPSADRSPLTPLGSGADFEEVQNIDVENFQEIDYQLPPPSDPLDGPEGPEADVRLPSQPTPPARGESRRWRRSVLLLFPLQLGLEKHVNEGYVCSVLRYFELRSSLGAMGGRPRMAHFFVGRHGRDLLYVDPHVVQPAAVPAGVGFQDDAAGFNGSSAAATGPESVAFFRNGPTVQNIPVEHIDASISLAFYCRDESELKALIGGLRNIEAAEANAPIRAEQTRPAALREACFRDRCSPPFRADSSSFSFVGDFDGPLTLPLADVLSPEQVSVAAAVSQARGKVEVLVSAAQAPRQAAAVKHGGADKAPGIEKVGLATSQTKTQTQLHITAPRQPTAAPSIVLAPVAPTVASGERKISLSAPWSVIPSLDHFNECT